MKLSSSLLEPVTSVSKGPSKRPGALPAWLRCLAGPLLCFAVALAACALQNLHQTSMQIASLFDAGWYLGTCDRIVHAWADFNAHPSVAALIAACQSMDKDIMTNGPVLPVLGASVFLALHKMPSVLDMHVPILLEGILHALDAALICLLANRMTGSRKWGAATGVCWALYPAAVIGSGIFLTETPTVFLLLSLVFCLTQIVYSRRNWAAIPWGLIAGFLGACAALAKPALLSAVAAICLLTLIVRGPKRARIFFSSSLIVGALIVMVPWLAYSKVVTGQFYLTPQRLPTLNVVLGSNPETDGWGNLNQLETPFVKLYPNQDSPAATLIGLWQTNPEGYVNLSLRKMARLWAAPWNDYRTPYFGLKPMQQFWWHAFLVAAAAFGILAFLARSTSRFRIPYERFVGYSSLIVIGGHLLYLIFATTGRYGFTAMPFLVLFAGYGFAYLWSNSCSRKVFAAAALVMATSCAILAADLMPPLSLIAADITRLASLQFAVKAAFLGIAIGFAALLIARCQKPDRLSIVGALAPVLLLSLLCGVQYAFATDRQAIREWQCPLEAGGSIKREVVIPAGIAKLGTPDWALVVFDGNAESSTVQVNVNGHAIAAKPVPLCLYNANVAEGAYYQQLAYYEMFSGLMRTTFDGIRQWRAIKVPVALLQTNGNNVITLTAEKPETIIYGAYPPAKGGARRTLSFLEFSTNRLMDGRTDELEPRVGAAMPLPKVKSQSSLVGSESDDLSTSIGKQFGEYRLYLALGYLKTGETGQPIPLASEGFTDTVTGPLPVDPKAGLGRIEHLPPQLFDQNHVAITVSGTLRSNGPAIPVNALVLLRGLAFGEGTDLELPAVPKQFTAESGGSPLLIEGELPTSALPKGEKALQILFSSSKPGVAVENFHCEVRPTTSADFTNHLVEML